MEVERAGTFQHSMKLNQPGRHVHQIRHGVVLADQGAERGECIRNCVVELSSDVSRVLAVSYRSPSPGVIECLDLSALSVGCHLVTIEDDVVGPVAVEGRIEIDEVDRFRRHVLPEDLKVVAVEEPVHGFPSVKIVRLLRPARRWSRSSDSLGLCHWMRRGALNRRAARLPYRDI